MTTGFAGPYDLVAATVMAILAGVLEMGISIHPAVAGMVPPHLAAFLIIVAARAAWVGFRQGS
jgi:hypothetical protein